MSNFILHVTMCVVAYAGFYCDIRNDRSIVWSGVVLDQTTYADTHCTRRVNNDLLRCQSLKLKFKSAAACIKRILLLRVALQ